VYLYGAFVLKPVRTGKRAVYLPFEDDAERPTLELLDALDARLGPLGAAIAAARQIPPAALSSDALRVRMDLAGLTKATFSSIFGISEGFVREMLDGTRPIPSWAPVCIRMFQLLTPTQQRQLLQPQTAQTGRKRSNAHPFSRIEDL
jgi:hypothetical protein